MNANSEEQIRGHLRPFAVRDLPRPADAEPWPLLRNASEITSGFLRGFVPSCERLRVAHLNLLVAMERNETWHKTNNHS